MTNETSPHPIYVISPVFSGVRGYLTRSDADSYLAEDEHAVEVPAAQVDPDVRRYHEDRRANYEDGDR